MFNWCQTEAGKDGQMSLNRKKKNNNTAAVNEAGSTMSSTGYNRDVLILNEEKHSSMDLLLKSAGGTNRNCPRPPQQNQSVRSGIVFFYKSVRLMLQLNTTCGVLCVKRFTSVCFYLLKHVFLQKPRSVSSLCPAELDCRSQTFNLIIALVADIHIFTFQRPCFSINVFAFSF